MKCPHCEYEHGWSNTSMTKVDDKATGDFYQFPIQMSREAAYSYHYSKDEVSVYACPSCKKMFIGD